MSVSFCRTPLFRTLSVGIAALCIAHTPALADDPPPPGAQHFDFAAAWGRPAVPFTSFSALLRKDHDETIPEELQCNESQCGTWIGDEHSPEDEFDLIGTLTFIDVVPFPEEFNRQPFVISQVAPDLTLEHGLDAEVAIEYFYVTAILTTPIGYEAVVSGFAAKSVFDFTEPEVVQITGTGVHVLYQWNNELDALVHAQWTADLLYHTGIYAFPISSETLQPQPFNQLPNGGTPSLHVHSIGGNPNGDLYAGNPGNHLECSPIYDAKALLCEQTYKDTLQEILDEFNANVAGARAAYQAAIDSWGLGDSLWAGLQRGAVVGATCGGVGVIVGSCVPIIGNKLGGALGLAGGFVGGFTGGMGTAKADFMLAELKKLNLQMENFDAIGEQRWCFALRDLRPCLRDALDSYIDCMKDGIPYYIPLDPLFPQHPLFGHTVMPSNCPHVGPIHPGVQPVQSPVTSPQVQP